LDLNDFLIPPPLLVSLVWRLMFTPLHCPCPLDHPLVV
jgi:hypothetical protein